MDRVERVPFPFRRHPFSVVATLEHSVVLTYAAERRDLDALVPAPLDLDVLDGSGFVAVAMVKTRGLRPAAFPSVLGADFFLLGYRVFVRYRSVDGRRMRGLYILRSETDSRRMKILGDWFTAYRYRTTDVAWRTEGDRTEVRSDRSQLAIAVREGTETAALPPGSPFSTWKEARRYAGPMPHTFAVDPGRRRVLIVTARRGEWQPRPLVVEHARCSFLEGLGLSTLRLASAFAVSEVSYRWERGQEESWPLA